MFVALGIVIILVCLLLIGIVLIQNPKGGGVNATFGGVSNQILGAGRTTNVVERFTWYFAIALLLLSMVAVLVVPEGKLDSKEIELSEVEKGIQEGGVPTAAPTAPALPSQMPSQMPQQTNPTAPAAPTK